MVTSKRMTDRELLRSCMEAMHIAHRVQGARTDWSLMMEDIRRHLESSAHETTRDDARDAVRYRWLRDWYHREGKRAEIDPYGHIAVRTLPEWEALLDAAIARSSPVEPSEQPPVETGLRTGELAQLRRIDAAARFYVDSVKPSSGLAWENLMNALFDGRPEKATEKRE